MTIRLLAFTLMILVVGSTNAQDLTDKTSLNVFIDCRFCSDNYIKSKIRYINYVRDAELADVHILATKVKTGVDNFTYMFDFIGKGIFKDQNFKLTFKDEPNSTKQYRNELFSKKIELGLVPYWMQTQMTDRISLKVKNDVKRLADKIEQEEDPWNSWVFSVEGGGNGELETNKHRITVWGRLRANHVTETWRIRNQIYLRHQQRQFRNKEDIILRNSDSNFAFTDAVRSINNHFSVGIRGEISTSTYGNLDLGTQISPAFEYSLFPYQEVNRREVTLSYRINQMYQDYEEETVYEKWSEYLWSQSLVLSVRYHQPWGTLSTQVEGSHFLHDRLQNRVEFSNRLSLRVMKGLSVTINGNFDIINDQRSLPRRNTSLEDLLLAQRQIATNFRLSGSFGIKYAFGSAFNNVVNTRL